MKTKKVIEKGSCGHAFERPAGYTNTECLECLPCAIKHAEGTHTPTPWRVEEDIEIIAGKNEKEVCIADIEGSLDSGSIDRANAAFIVRAVNAHEEMLEALYQALPYVEDQLQDEGYKPGAVERRVKFIKQAIAKGEGK